MDVGGRGSSKRKGGDFKVGGIGYGKEKLKILISMK